MYLETDKQITMKLNTVPKHTEKVADVNGHSVLTCARSRRVVSCMFFAQHGWLIIQSNWPQSREASSSQEVVNGDLTTSSPLQLHRGLNLHCEMLELAAFLSCVFTLPGMGLGSVCDGHNNSIKDRLCHMDSYLNRLLGSAVTTTTWSGFTSWTALHAFLHKYIDAHLDNAHAMHLSLSLIPLPFLMPRELEGSLKCLT